MSADRIRVRRRRKSLFAAIPHAFARDPSIDDKAFRLWVLLQSYADWDDETCFPSVGLLAQQMGCHRSSVARAATVLVKHKLLEIESGQLLGAPNVYTVVDPPEGDAPVRQGYSTHALPPSAPVRQGGSAPMRHKQEPKEREPLNETLFDSFFERFYEVYPRKKAKLTAKAAFRKAVGIASPEVIIAGAKWYRDLPGRDPQFTAYPATWLNNRRWEDEPDDESARADAEPAYMPVNPDAVGDWLP